MEQKQLKGLSKFIALLVISALVISVIIFTASGNSFSLDSTNATDTKDETQQPNDNSSENNSDNEIDGDNQDKNDGKNETTPTFKNILTGLDISESEYNSCAYGIVIDPSETIYGLSYADIAIEFPTELGTSRMLFFSVSDDIIWKIGALAPTRKFITSMSSYFGGIIVSYGEDDNVNYNISNTGALIDISKHNDCSYNDNGTLYYTNEKLIDVALNRTQYIANSNQYKTPPFIISSEGVSGGISCASTVMIPYSNNNFTQLTYDASTDKYIYTKNSTTKNDMLNGNDISFTNAFILFADTTTYESSTASELVINTESGGNGYYFHNGKMTEIRWSSSNGKLLFTNLMGEVLEVNPGNSYISFYKASEYGNIKMS